ncbi:MAG TPA: hypothetical protein VKB91_12025 [Gemmatimonadaceae bacterium]|nr:hypothetical protein [Gemmatimonadaceae bacterium]
MKPAVDPISTALAAYDLVWLAVLERFSPRREDVWTVIRMNGAGARPSSEFLQRRAEVFEHCPVGEFELTVRCHKRDEGWKVIDDRAEIVLARRRRKPPSRMSDSLKATSVVNLAVHSAPLDDLPGRVA